MENIQRSNGSIFLFLSLFLSLSPLSRHFGLTNMCSKYFYESEFFFFVIVRKKDIICLVCMENRKLGTNDCLTPWPVFEFAIMQCTKQVSPNAKASKRASERGSMAPCRLDARSWLEAGFESDSHKKYFFTFWGHFGLNHFLALFPPKTTFLSVLGPRYAWWIVMNENKVTVFL